jgi:hypothetical protein
MDIDEGLWQAVFTHFEIIQSCRPTTQYKELDAMSRPILDITLRLPDGRVLTGRGRNVPATMERIYNNALNSTPRRHVRFLEHLNPGEGRYRGTYQVQFGYRSGPNTALDGVVQAEVGGPR